MIFKQAAIYIKSSQRDSNFSSVARHPSGYQTIRVSFTLSEYQRRAVSKKQSVSDHHFSGVLKADIPKLSPISLNRELSCVATPEEMQEVQTDVTSYYAMANRYCVLPLDNA